TASATACSGLSTPPAGGQILSGPFVGQLCFDSSTGFLKRHRMLIGLSPQAHDVLSVFTSNSSGNLTREDYYGGDAHSLDTASNVCTSSLAGQPLVYSIAHTYSSGTLATSKFQTTDDHNDIVGFFNLDQTIDPSTGLASQSRDTAGLATDYAYDALGRITTLSPPAVASTSYDYTDASASSP